jgi:hypothetical protein
METLQYPGSGSSREQYYWVKHQSQRASSASPTSCSLLPGFFSESDDTNPIRTHMRLTAAAKESNLLVVVVKEVNLD